MRPSLEASQQTRDAAELELVAKLIAKDNRAWREFHERYTALIRRCIARVCMRFPRLCAEEDVAEVMANLTLSLAADDMRKLRAWSPDRGARFSTWIGMLATHAAWDLVRSAARQPRMLTATDVDLIESEATTEETVLAGERLEALYSVLPELTTKDKTFLRLYFVDECSPEDVAARMSISLNTVYSKKHKLRARLAERLSLAA